jgi:hypothetical protein
MLLHADAIAQNRAAGLGTGGVDREHADLLALIAQHAGELIAQGAFACARRSCHAEDHGVSSARKQVTQ